MKVELTMVQQDQHQSDQSAQEIPVTISKEELRELSRVNSLHGAVHVLAEWSLIFAAIYACQHFWTPLLYVATVVWIGSRQHALMILMHDGVHYRLFRGRFFNEWVSEIVLSWPVLISARAYRRNHFAHHRYLNTENDPDWARRQGDPSWVFPKSPAELSRMLLQQLTGPGAIGLMRLAARLVSKDAGMTRRFIVARYSFYLAVVGVLLYFGSARLVVYYWFIPLFTWLIFIFRIRSIAEHSAVESKKHFYAQTRTTLPSFLERIFVAPKNVNYHLEHHLYPSVPFYRLPKLHTLLASKPEFQGAHVTQTYLGVLRECIEDAPLPSMAAGTAKLAGFTLQPSSGGASQ